MTRVYMVRHGRAAAGWDVDPDPPLDDVGRNQALAVAGRLSSCGPLAVVSSPLLRCRQTAFPLATAWKQNVSIESRVGEIPSPDGYALEDRVTWLREVMAGTWSEAAESSGERYARYRRSIADCIAGFTEHTVVFSHFVAINAVIGAATDDDRVLIASLDNCSVTTFDVHDGKITLVEVGGEADTLIR